MHIIEILGRLLLSAIFLINGIGKIFNYEGTIQYMENFDVPGYLIIPAITVEILFPILLILGYYTKFSALVLSLFTLALAVIVIIIFPEIALWLPQQMIQPLK